MFMSIYQHLRYTIRKHRRTRPVARRIRELQEQFIEILADFGG